MRTLRLVTCTHSVRGSKDCQMEGFVKGRGGVRRDGAGGGRLGAELMRARVARERREKGEGSGASLSGRSEAQSTRGSWGVPAFGWHARVPSWGVPACGLAHGSSRVCQALRGLAHAESWGGEAVAGVSPPQEAPAHEPVKLAQILCGPTAQLGWCAPFWSAWMCGRR